MMPTIPRFCTAVFVAFFATWAMTATAVADDGDGPDALTQHQWSASFPVDKLQTYVENEDIERLFVAGVGQPEEDAEIVVDLLTQRFEEIDETWTVVDGVIDDADDEEIVDQAQNLRSDRAVVARMHEGDGWVPVVEMTIYDAEGEYLVSAVTRRGTPITRAGVPDEIEVPEPAEEPEEPDEPEPQVDQVGEQPDPEPQPDDSVASEQPDPQPDEVDAQQEKQAKLAELEREYESDKIEWRDGEAYDGFHKLEGEEFYRAVGKHHLAGDYRPRRGWLGWMGFVPVFVGGMIAAAGFFGMAEGEEGAGAVALVGTGMWVGGLWMMIVAEERHPLDASERERAVQDHNRKLRQELGLPTMGGPSARGRQFRPSTVVPSIDNSAGMLNTGGSAMLGITLNF